MQGINPTPPLPTPEKKDLISWDLLRVDCQGTMERVFRKTSSGVLPGESHTTAVLGQVY